jgi:argininosuccinate lyase
VVQGLPGGYNRDLQEIKEPYIHGLETTRQSLRVMARIIDGLEVDKAALKAGFTPGVFATDRAVQLVADGMPFRDAYDAVRSDLASLEAMDPGAAVAAKTHLGGTAGLDLDALAGRMREIGRGAKRRRTRFDRTVTRLLGVPYPALA